MPIVGMGQKEGCGTGPVIRPSPRPRRTGNNGGMLSDIRPHNALVLLNIGAIGRRVAA